MNFCHGKSTVGKVSKMSGKLRNMTAIYISCNDKMLLLYRVGSKIVEPSWCGIGGHFENFELNNAKACVLRELHEELNVSSSELINLQLRYVTLRLKNEEIRQNYYFFADLKSDLTIELQCNEGAPEWVDYGDILKKEMPHSARFVLNHYLGIGKNTVHIYGGIATKNNVCFTLLEEF